MKKVEGQLICAWSPTDPGGGLLRLNFSRATQPILGGGFCAKSTNSPTTVVKEMIGLYASIDFPIAMHHHVIFL